VCIIDINEFVTDTGGKMGIFYRSRPSGTGGADKSAGAANPAGAANTAGAAKTAGPADSSRGTAKAVYSDRETTGAVGETARATETAGGKVGVRSKGKEEEETTRVDHAEADGVVQPVDAAAVPDADMEQVGDDTRATLDLKSAIAADDAGSGVRTFKKQIKEDSEVDLVANRTDGDQGKISGNMN
jgi:hypothetical protein